MDSQDYRRDPDQLLRSLEKVESNKTKGNLHVFFGMCPGVGKTYAMLRSAHELKAKGHDVVVGIVETHKRSETEKLLQDLECIPLQVLEHRETKLQELNLDAVLQRKPEIVLVDELAHTNAPGSRHSKRYQDVLEILQSGITVFTTLNVQHIESRADLVFQITSVPVRETVPDSFLELADEINLIDLSPQELLTRLREGKVYLGERAERAAENFFKIEKLTALRELALRFTAEKVDEQLRSHMTLKQIMGPWNTNERLLVAVSYSPYSARLIRATRRMAYNLEAPWIALYVETAEELSAEDQRRLHKNLTLAKELGAEVVHTRESKVSSAIMRVAQEKNVTQIVMGRPDRRFFRDLFARGTILDQLVHETSQIDIHVIRQERKPHYRGFHFRLPNQQAGFFPYWTTLWFLLGVTGLSYALLPMIGYRAVGFIYLVAVLAVGTLATFGPIFFAAGFSALAWNFFFIPPQFTFYFREAEDALMCAAFLIVACVAGFLAHRIRRQEKDLLQREHRASALYEFGKLLAEAKTIKDIATRAAESIEQVFGAKAAILKKAVDDEGLLHQPLNFYAPKFSEKDFAVAAWTLQNGKNAGWGTDTLSSADCFCLPLFGTSGPIGVLMTFLASKTRLTMDQENLLETFAAHIGIALERVIFESKAKETVVLEKSERLHQALLNSVSHELRTPLTTIMGTATALQDLSAAFPEGRQQLLTDLVDSSERLNRVIENLLDMSRIASGVLELKKDLIEVNDFVSSTLRRSERLLAKHRIELRLASQQFYVQGDARLLEHVLVNLLVNACAYSPEKTIVKVETLLREDKAIINVQDEGPGIQEKERKKIFERFYQIPGTSSGGTGLGLSIAKSLVEAHGGKIWVQDRTDQHGSIFSFALPVVDIGSELGVRL